MFFCPLFVNYCLLSYIINQASKEISTVSQLQHWPTAILPIQVHSPFDTHSLSLPPTIKNFWQTQYTTKYEIHLPSPYPLKVLFFHKNITEMLCNLNCLSWLICKNCTLVQSPMTTFRQYNHLTAICCSNVSYPFTEDT